MWRLSAQGQALVEQLYGLLTSTSWFGRGSREERIVTLLGQMQVQGEPGAVVIVARCLFHPSMEVRVRASQTIQHLLSLVSPEHLIHLSGRVSMSWDLYISQSWDALTPKDIAKLLVDPPSRVGILGLLSFHRNGYVRQEAVRLLASLMTGDELRYLLIRQNDWVDIIAKEAQVAVYERLTPSNLLHFLGCLPLVTHLLSFRRRNLLMVVRRVVEMLVEPQQDAVLTQVLHGPNRSVRRQVLEIALDLPGKCLGTA